MPSTRARGVRSKRLIAASEANSSAAATAVTALAAFQLLDPAEVAIPSAGGQLRPFDTPTVDDPRGVDPICSRLEGVCPLHEVTLTQALAAELGAETVAIHQPRQRIEQRPGRQPAEPDQADPAQRHRADQREGGHPVRRRVHHEGELLALLGLSPGELHPTGLEPGTGRRRVAAGVLRGSYSLELEHVLHGEPACTTSRASVARPRTHSTVLPAR